MGFLALYFILIFVGLGVGGFYILKEQLPDQDPFVIINNFMFYWIIANIAIRFALQKLPVMNAKPFLILDIKKTKIAHYLLLRSTTSIFNILPIFFMIPYCVVLLIEGYQASVVISWFMFMLMTTLILSFSNFINEIKTSDKDLSFLPTLIVLATFMGLNNFGIVDFNSLLGYAISVLTGSSIYLIVPLILLSLSYYILFNSLKGKMTLDDAFKKEVKEVNASEMKWTSKFGDLAPFIQLDLKLIWRNKRPKSTLFILVIGFAYGLIFYTNDTYMVDMKPMLVFVGIFITGIFMINFGQFIPAWDGAYYKMLMSQNFKYHQYLEAKLRLMTMSVVISFILSTPYVYFGWHILWLHLAAMLYNIGVNSLVILFFGSFNKKKIELDKKAAFNYQGTGAAQWLSSIPLMLAPILLFYIPYKFISFNAGILTLAILGIIGIVLNKIILKAIVKRYKASKYKMIAGFSQIG